jgi:hypothetical protein
MDAAPIDAHMNMSNGDDAATIIQTRFRGISVRTMKPRARLQAEFDAVMGDGEASVSASDAATNVVDDDDQESVNFDAGSNTAEADTTMEATEAEQNDDFEEEEVEVEVVQPAGKKKRMVLEVLSTLDGPYWNKETSRRKIVRE